MKKEMLKKDLKLLKKMDDLKFRNNIESAYQCFISLNIKSEILFIIYQMQLAQLKNVTYEEILSYHRLHDSEYFNSINSIKNKEKVITFPKFPN